MHIPSLRHLLFCILAVTIAVQGQVAVAQTCHISGHHSHAVTDHEGHHESLANQSIEEDGHSASNACAYCASICAMGYALIRTPVITVPGIDTSSVFLAPVKHYKSALLDGLIKPPRS